MRRLKPYLSVVAAFLVGCQDGNLPTMPDDIGQISGLINDGAHRDPVTNELGNRHFFFLTPMVPKDPKKFNGELNTILQPVVTACEFDVGGDPCSPDGPLILDAAADLDGEHYTFRWVTSEFNLAVDGKLYRVFVSIAGVPIGFADVDVVSTQRDFKLVNTQQFVPLLIDRTLPVKFRIEDGAICEALDPGSFEDGSCIEGGVDLNGESEVAFDDGSGVFIPNQGVNQQATLALLPCTVGDNLPVDLVTVGDCFRIATSEDLDFPLALPTVSVCVTLGELTAADLTTAQIELLRLHKREDNGNIRALPKEKDNCTVALPEIIPEGFGSLSSNPILRLAQRGWWSLKRGLAEFVGPSPLYASASMFINLQERGAGVGEFSEFQFALPSLIQVVPETNNQVAVVGTPVPNPPAVLVLDAEGNPVQGATVRFGVPDNEDGTVDPFDTPVPSGVNGIAQATSWELEFLGVNELDASGRGFGLPTSAGGTGAFVPNDATGTASDPLELGVVTFDATGIIGLFFDFDENENRIMAYASLGRIRIAFSYP